MHKIFIVNCVAHHMRWYWITVAIVAIIVGGLTYAGLSLLVVHSPYEKVVEKGDKVSVWYYGYIYYGKERRVFDTNMKKVADDNATYPKTISFKYPKKFEPLNFTVGSGQMIEGFDEGVVGMYEGETKLIIVPPEKGYKYDESKVKEIDRQIRLSVIENMTLDEFENKFNRTPYEGARYIEPKYGWEVLVADITGPNVKIIREVAAGENYYPYENLTSYYINVEAVDGGIIYAKIYAEKNIMLPDGGIIKDVSEDKITVDYNMEVAGKTLYFVVTVVYIEKS